MMLSDEEFMAHIRRAVRSEMLAGFDVKYGGNPYCIPGHFSKPGEVRQYMREDWGVVPDGFANLTLH